jgi:hypothetical protein
MQVIDQAKPSLIQFLARDSGQAMLSPSNQSQSFKNIKVF